MDEPTCCCGSIPATNGVIAFGIIAAVSTFFTALRSVSTGQPWTIAGSITYCLALFIIVYFLIQGIKKKKAKYIVPFLIIECIEFVLNFVVVGLGIACIAGAIDPKPYGVDEKTMRVVGAFVLVLAVLRFLYFGYVIRTVRNCQRYLNEYYGGEDAEGN